MAAFDFLNELRIICNYCGEQETHECLSSNDPFFMIKTFEKQRPVKFYVCRSCDEEKVDEFDEFSKRCCICLAYCKKEYSFLFQKKHYCFQCFNTFPDDRSWIINDRFYDFVDEYGINLFEYQIYNDLINTQQSTMVDSNFISLFLDDFENLPDYLEIIFKRKIDEANERKIKIETNLNMKKNELRARYEDCLMEWINILNVVDARKIIDDIDIIYSDPPGRFLEAYEFVIWFLGLKKKYE